MNGRVDQAMVFVLFHFELEEGEVRGVYARREDAELDVTTPEISEHWVNERMSRGRQAYGRRQDPHDGHWYINVRSVHEHDKYCCSVLEQPVLERPTGTVIVNGEALRAPAGLLR